MDIITDDDEVVKLLGVKDIEIIEPNDLIDENDENDKNTENKKPIDIQEQNNGADKIPNGIVEPCTERRSDEPTELSFEKGDEISFICHITFRVIVY